MWLPSLKAKRNHMTQGYNHLCLQWLPCVDQIILQNESNDMPKWVKNAPKVVRLHSSRQIMCLIESFDPVIGVILDICDYTPKGVIWITFSLQWFIPRDLGNNNNNNNNRQRLES